VGGLASYHSPGCLIPEPLSFSVGLVVQATLDLGLVYTTIGSVFLLPVQVSSSGSGDRTYRFLCMQGV
jgi:hypothetical protein